MDLLVNECNVEILVKSYSDEELFQIASIYTNVVLNYFGFEMGITDKSYIKDEKDELVGIFVSEETRIKLATKALELTIYANN